ncbi:MAG TPA: serine hydrolase domain-containing protein [Solirubrobacterales bacterium]
MSPSIPRSLPFVGDPLRRARIPSDLGAITTVGEEERAGDGGLSDELVEELWEAGTDLYRSGVHPALQLCVRRNGHVVLDRAIGHAHGNGPGDPEDGPKELATPQTPFCVYSTSKSVTATVIHLLQERGALSIEDRVGDHIPGYTRHGKHDITIAHVLSHRAGVASMPRDSLDLDNLTDREFLVEAICDAKPNYKPGQMLAYHAVSGGYILGEVVHRVTGKTIREVLAEEILGPLGFRWGNYGVAEADLGAVGEDYVTGPRLLPPVSLIVNRALGAPLDEVIEAANDDRFRTAIVPAANVITTANELSRFYEMLRCGGELDGVRVMEPATIRRALIEQSHLEVDLSLGFPTRFSYGFMLGAKLISLYGRDTDEAFGHLGLINIMGWADPERGVSVGLITSGKAIVYPELRRFLGVMGRIASRVPKLDPDDRAF